MTRLRRIGFVSYARDDIPLVECFLDLMRPRCATLRELELDAWWDRRILAGEPWERELENAIQAADFGVFCVTPAFLASAYATTRELPWFLGGRRMLFPVGVQPVDLARADLKGLEPLQIFRHRRPGTIDEHSFAECSSIGRLRFCDALVAQMADRLAAVGAG